MAGPAPPLNRVPWPLDVLFGIWSYSAMRFRFWSALCCCFCNLQLAATGATAISHLPQTKVKYSLITMVNIPFETWLGRGVFVEIKDWMEYGGWNRHFYLKKLIGIVILYPDIIFAHMNFLKLYYFLEPCIFIHNCYTYHSIWKLKPRRIYSNGNWLFQMCLASPYEQLNSRIRRLCYPDARHKTRKKTFLRHCQKLRSAS